MGRAISPAYYYYIMCFFNCKKCGCCCSLIGITIEKAKKVNDNTYNLFTKELLKFPYEYNSFGVCEKLDVNNNCTIYENRPDICNVEKLHKKYFSCIDKNKFFEINFMACRLLNGNKITASQNNNK